MIKRVLIAGFDPFGDDTVNPALEAAKQLDGKETNGAAITAVRVPTVFQEFIRVVKKAILQNKPDAVICAGQAGGRANITPERIAINTDDARIPDNKGQQPIDKAIAEEGPAAYWSSLPIKQMVHDINDAGIPAAVSNSAGTFVCNHLFYGLMHYLQKEAPGIRGGFIHIPFIPEQTITKDAPSLNLTTIVRGLEIAAITAALGEEDIRVSGGSLH